MSDIPQTISAEELCSLTGLSTRRHQQLAQQGYFPHAVESQYQFAATIQGIFKFYREHNQQTREKKDNAKERKLEVETRILLLKEAKENRTVATVSDIEKLLLHLSTMVKTIAYQRLGRELGARGEGKSAAELNVLGKTIAGELVDIMENGVRSWQDDNDEAVAPKA